MVSMISSIPRAVVFLAALVAISTGPGVFAETKNLASDGRGASGMDIVDLLDKELDDSFDLPGALRELTDLTFAPSASPTASPTATPSIASAAAPLPSSSTITSVTLVLATVLAGALIMA